MRRCGTTCDLIITDYTQLFAAMPALNPTILIAPPVLYQMIHTEYEKYPGWKKALWTVLGSLLALLPSPSLRQGIGAHRCSRISTSSSAATFACW